MKNIRGVIFDIDGTLLDSNDAHAAAWVTAFRDFGVQVSHDDVRPLIGKGGDHVLEELAGLADDAPLAEKIAARRKEVFARDHMPHLQPFEGARALVQTLRERGLKLVVGTSASEAEMRPLLVKAGVADLFHRATNADDVEQSKPAPDIIEAALEKVGLGPDEAVMVGDTPFDIEAARKAGVATIAFRSGGWGDKELHGAAGIYDGPADLLARLDKSLLGVVVTDGAARRA